MKKFLVMLVMMFMFVGCSAPASTEAKVDYFDKISEVRELANEIDRALIGAYEDNPSKKDAVKALKDEYSSTAITLSEKAVGNENELGLDDKYLFDEAMKGLKDLRDKVKSENP